jgi:hypothetical protein
MTAPAIQLDYALPGTRRRRRRVGVGLLALVVLVGSYVGCWVSIKRAYVDIVWWGAEFNYFAGPKVEHPLVDSRIAKAIFTPAHWVDAQWHSDFWSWGTHDSILMMVDD